MEKIKNLITKYKSQLIYLFFGGCTTIVNLVVFQCMCKIASVTISNICSIIVAVIFAYFTNAKFVFHGELNLKTFAKFVSARGVSAVIEIAGVYILNLITTALIAKLITQVIVVVLNYIFSKIFVFSKNS